MNKSIYICVRYVYSRKDQVKEEPALSVPVNWWCSKRWQRTICVCGKTPWAGCGRTHTMHRLWRAFCLSASFPLRSQLEKHHLLQEYCRNEIRWDHEDATVMTHALKQAVFFKLLSEQMCVTGNNMSNWYLYMYSCYFPINKHQHKAFVFTHNEV